MSIERAVAALSLELAVAGASDPYLADEWRESDGLHPRRKASAHIRFA
jgi:hypothetical protein